MAGWDGQHSTGPAELEMKAGCGLSVIIIIKHWIHGMAPDNPRATSGPGCARQMSESHNGGGNWAMEGGIDIALQGQGQGL